MSLSLGSILSVVRRNALHSLMGSTVAILLLSSLIVIYVRYAASTSIACIVFLLFVALSAIIQLFGSLAILHNNKLSPILKTLVKNGDLDELIMQLNNDLIAPITIINQVTLRPFFGSEDAQLILTPNFLVVISDTDFSLVALNKIIWVYTKGGITWRGGLTLHVIDRDGSEIGVRAKLNATNAIFDPLVSYIRENHPLVLYGYSKELVRLQATNIQKLIDLAQHKAQTDMP